MELKISLTAPPSQLAAARNLIASAIRELHPGYVLTREVGEPLNFVQFESDLLDTLASNLGIERATLAAATHGRPNRRESDLVTDEPEGRSEPPKVDMHGVAYNADYCANAEDPFYASGERKGQWKKRRGVEESAYDAWYATQRQPVASEGEGQAMANTSAAFGSRAAAPSMFRDEPDAYPDGKGAPPPPPAVAAPKDTGGLMVWVSEKQAAGALTQADIDQAYRTAGLGVQDMFPPNDAATVAGRVATIYQLLAAKAGA